MSRVIAAGLAESIDAQRERDLLDVYSKAEVDAETGSETLRVELGGDFNAGEEIVGYKQGPRVTLVGVGSLNHVASVIPQSLDNLLPASWRPTHSQVNCYDDAGDLAFRMAVSTSGRIILKYNSSTGSESRTTSGDIPNITYLIAGDIP